MCFSHNTASAQFDETPNLYGIGARFVNCELQVQLTIVIICQDKSVAEVANVICLSSSVVFVCCLWKFNNSWTIAKITLKPVLRSSIFPSQFKVFHLDELHRFIFNLSAVIFLWFFRVCSFARHYSILYWQSPRWLMVDLQCVSKRQLFQREDLLSLPLSVCICLSLLASYLPSPWVLIWLLE